MKKAALSDDAMLQVTRQVLARFDGQLGTLLPILHAIQQVIGHIPALAVPVIAEALQRSRAEIQGVISFYPHFRQTPAGRHVLEICRAEACQAMGGEALAERARQQLGSGQSPETVLDWLAHTLTNKLLHTPTTALREAAVHGDVELMRMFERLLPAHETPDAAQPAPKT